MEVRTKEIEKKRIDDLKKFVNLLLNYLNFQIKENTELKFTYSELQKTKEVLK